MWGMAFPKKEELEDLREFCNNCRKMEERDAAKVLEDSWRETKMPGTVLAAEEGGA